MRAPALAAAMAESNSLRALLLLYVRTLYIQTSYTALVNVRDANWMNGWRAGFSYARTVYATTCSPSPTNSWLSCPASGDRV